MESTPVKAVRTPHNLFPQYVAKILPLAFDESMSYYECLCALVEIINNNAQATAENQEQVKQLTEFVNNYFTNLDVQQEINNKLDQMVEDGTLAKIINFDILNAKIESVPTATELKQSPEGQFHAGQVVETLGYYAEDDGGSAKYLIMANGEPNDMDVLELAGGLFAHMLFPNEILNLRAFGANGEGSVDNTAIIQYAVNFANSNELTLFIPDGTYKITSTIVLGTADDAALSSGQFAIIGNGSNTIFEGTGTDMRLFDHQYAYNLILKNFRWSKASWSLIPNNVYDQGFNIWSKYLTKANIVIENIGPAAGGTGEGYGFGKVARAPKETGRFADENYASYPVYIMSNSGYAGIEIDNMGYTQSGETANPPDNSAISIINNATTSAGVLSMFNYVDTAFLRLNSRRAGAITSPLIQDMVTQIDHRGHLNIGCSGDFSEGNSTAAIKIRDNIPAIVFLDMDLNQGTQIRYTTDKTTQIYNRGTIGIELISINGFCGNKGPHHVVSEEQAYYFTPFTTVYDTVNKKSFDALLSVGRQGLGIDINGKQYFAQPVLSGSTAERPLASKRVMDIGLSYFDTTLNKPIWWNGTGWKDATGASV